MSYIDDYIQWLRSRGAEFELLTDEPSWPPQVQREIPADAPIEVLQWFASPLPGRRDGLGAVIDDEGFFYLPGDQTVYDQVPEEYDELKAIGAFPNDPIPFARISKIELHIEPHGPHAGWIYASYEPGIVIGPIAASISQYLAAIRALVEHGFLPDPGNRGASYSAREAGDPWPPLDTPGPFLGSPTVDLRASYAYYGRNAGMPIADSIVDLVPGFQLVTMKL